jgi:hypothetical protein
LEQEEVRRVKRKATEEKGKQAIRDLFQNRNPVETLEVRARRRSWLTNDQINTDRLRIPVKKWIKQKKITSKGNNANPSQTGDILVSPDNSINPL